MLMRVTVGGHLGEIVEMPYHVALQAVDSGTAEYAVPVATTTRTGEDPAPRAQPVRREKAERTLRRHAHR